MEVKLRKYQEIALAYALKEGRSVIVLPTGTGKTIIGIAFVKKLLKKNHQSKALILVPTRILVEQTEKFYRKFGLDAIKIYGILPKKKRIELWKKAKVVIATPETVYNDIDYIKDFDIIVVDECHHAIGNDAYAKVLRRLQFKYILGLSAHIPKRRKKEIENLIGKIKEWSPTDPILKKYIPSWIGDIFEAPFLKEEYEIYKIIEDRRLSAKKSEKLLYTLALRYLASDGALALKESILKKTKLALMLNDIKEKVLKLRDLHKLDSLKRILYIYEDFEKAIVFVDRVVVAKKLFEILRKKYDTSLIIGRLGKELKNRLEEAKKADIIISTSAGEEGVDLPSSDLLIIWSNTTSPLRFIQRHGRILRPSKPLKYATYIVTPDTIDMDFFLIGIENVKKYIDINIENSSLRKVWEKSRLKKILDILYDPLPIEWIKELTGHTINEVRKALEFGLRNGEIIYIYTRKFGKVYVKKDHLEILKEKFIEDLTPKKIGKVRIKIGNRYKNIVGDFEKLYKELRKRLPLNNLKVIIISKENELTVYDYRSYNFVIDLPEVLEIVLKNALS